MTLLILTTCHMHWLWYKGRCHSVDVVSAIPVRGDNQLSVERWWMTPKAASWFWSGNLSYIPVEWSVTMLLATSYIIQGYLDDQGV